VNNMASVISDRNGRKRLQFVASDGSRKTLRLGRATARQAEAIKPKIEQLVLASTGITGVIDDETAKWLTGLDERMYDKLASVGLVTRRESVKLRAFLEAYIAERSDVQPATAISYRQVAGALTAFSAMISPCGRLHPARQTSGGYILLDWGWPIIQSGGGAVLQNNSIAWR
jgi:hypothetical protein